MIIIKLNRAQTENTENIEGTDRVIVNRLPAHDIHVHHDRIPTPHRTTYRYHNSGRCKDAIIVPLIICTVVHNTSGNGTEVSLTPLRCIATFARPQYGSTIIRPKYDTSAHGRNQSRDTEVSLTPLRRPAASSSQKHIK